MKRAALLTLCTACCALANVYYVDRRAGSDAADGLSPAAAWQSLARVQRARFGPGDYVLLRRGEVWREALIVSASGSADLPVTFGAWGTGAPPILDGTQSAGDVVEIRGGSDIVVRDLDIRNSRRNGISADNVSRLAIRRVAVSASRLHGILIWAGGSVLIEDSEIFGNSLDTSQSHDGIRIDAKPGTFRDFTVRGCRIHDNIGGEGWNSANGIFVGHTGADAPTLLGVTIAANEVYRNGNPNQNQAGRGITGTFHGDVTLSANYVYRNASAGVYLGDHAMLLDITIRNNIFYDNALRQFGGFTDKAARVWQNCAFVDDPSLTAMGAEIGGRGPWNITDNVFYYETATDDVWRGFIRINDATEDRVLSTDRNLYYSPGPKRWKKSDGAALAFPEWQSSGFDRNGRNPQ